ncbi:MAG: alpha-amylase [Lyngbya sp. HA4199-MV5]|nr:alpha-amylase [Lyngbya sp. HA4199-MV5]
MTATNGTIMQYFHWYTLNDGNHWQEVTSKADELAKAGFTALWLPPAYKGSSGISDVGYGVYDLFDLGEFDQKGAVRTKYGTREQYLAAIQALQAVGIQVYADVVLNQKDGGDATETVKATPFDSENRLQPKGGLEDISTYSSFKFTGRKGKYSALEWHWYHFDAVTYNHYKSDDRSTVYVLEGKSFDNFVSLEKGNFAYLLGCDLDMESEAVRDELTAWGKWYLDTTGVDGFRLDAVKHISSWFYVDWLQAMRDHVKRDLTVIGEYWSADIASLHWYLGNTGGCMSLFDVPLHFNFSRASKAGDTYDMRQIFDGTLMQQQPALAVTFVENHDSQPLQALESVVESWFKPLAYALILLRQEGYPCVFYADYYGAHYVDRGYEIWLDTHRWLLDKFLYARQHAAYGAQYDYFDHPNLIGWTRLGDKAHPGAIAVVMSNGAGGSKWMEVGKPNTTFTDLTEHIKTPIQTNADGWGAFACSGGSVSVWLEQV